jgi:antitoxin VapB
MSLHLKHPDALALASELARRMDMSLTDAVVVSLREKLATLTQVEDARRLKIQRALEISRACAATLDAETLAIDHGELLYDEFGLPK